MRNNADQMVFQTEKALGEFGDKVSAEEKSEVETKLSALKEALKSGSIDDIKAKQGRPFSRMGRFCVSGAWEVSAGALRSNRYFVCVFFRSNGIVCALATNRE